jgi:hypothetical protein
MTCPSSSIGDSDCAIILGFFELRRLDSIGIVLRFLVVVVIVVGVIMCEEAGSSDEM